MQKITTVLSVAVAMLVLFVVLPENALADDQKLVFPSGSSTPQKLIDDVDATDDEDEDVGVGDGVGDGDGKASVQEMAAYLSQYHSIEVDPTYIQPCDTDDDGYFSAEEIEACTIPEPVLMK